MIPPLFVTRALAFALALATLGPVCSQSQRDCSRTSVGFTPLSDLTGVGAGYRGRTGGLWGDGSNVAPASHAAAGAAIAATIAPRDAGGSLDPNGRIGVLSLGMSNTSMQFSTWKQVSDADPDRAAAVTVVDGAQGGQDARIWADPSSSAWSVLDQRLATAGITAAQVQVLWMKHAGAVPVTLNWPDHVDELEGLLVTILHNVHARFPNARLCYISTRNYGGYTLRADRGEPRSYEVAFAVQSLLRRQAAGDPELAFDPSVGAIRSPWLDWGSYSWADGLMPRSDGLQWECSDFLFDGIHPSQAGRSKVAAQLDAHFRGHPTTAPWYLGSGGGTRASVTVYGSACAGSQGLPQLRANGVPSLGNAGYSFGALRLAPNAPTSAILSLGAAAVPLGASGCTLLVDPAIQLGSWPFMTNAFGLVRFPVPIPADPAAAGFTWCSQWIVLDPAGALDVPGAGRFAVSAGQRHVVGDGS